MKQVRQKTIGINPLDHYLSLHTNTHQEQHQETQQKQEQELASQEIIQLAAPTPTPALTPMHAHAVGAVNASVSASQVTQESGPAKDLVTQILENETIQGKKQRVTLHVPHELLDKVKNAVYWEPGLTLAGFAEYALEKAVEQLEQERGTPFPDRKIRRLRGGRPLK